MATLNLRLPDEELEILLRYCDQTERTQTEVVRSCIRSLESKLGKRLTPQNIKPYLLPSVPLPKWTMLSPVSAVYFVMDEETVVYIGQSKDIRTRFISNHHKRQEMLEKYPNGRIHWVERSKVTRQKFERECIIRFSPCLNAQ